ncbi:hypothetical protein C8J57DRAFT_1335838 [Mycena rebaudengoi]|nr:hypothetical protein C8J57DRAFT_1335838 [Mycena rebaudengoi]
MSSCVHALNSDISGIGVRISYYLQTLLLACLSVRSGSVDEISGALYTLMATNTAMAVTGLILGLKPNPEITFEDAVIMVYLLSMGWITVLASLAFCNRLSDKTKILQLVSVIQGYVILAFAFAVLATAPSFGQSPQCNHEAVAVIFRPFAALQQGRVLGWCLVSLMLMGYTAMTVWDYLAPLLEPQERENSENVVESRPPIRQEPFSTSDFVLSAPANTTTLQRPASVYEETPALVDENLLTMLLFILIVWAFFVLNIELVIHWYQPSPDNSVPNWQFGQILPLFLTLLPFIQMSSAFNRFGVKPTKLVEGTAMISVINDNEYDNQQKSLLKKLRARRSV